MMYCQINIIITDSRIFVNMRNKIEEANGMKSCDNYALLWKFRGEFLSFKVKHKFSKSFPLMNFHTEYLIG